MSHDCCTEKFLLLVKFQTEQVAVLVQCCDDITTCGRNLCLDSLESRNQSSVNLTQGHVDTIEAYLCIRVEQRDGTCVLIYADHYILQTSLHYGTQGFNALVQSAGLVIDGSDELGCLTYDGGTESLLLLAQFNTEQVAVVVQCVDDIIACRRNLLFEQLKAIC